jgi:tRNA(His) 5'-end guanylyltransferase
MSHGQTVLRNCATLQDHRPQIVQASLESRLTSDAATHVTEIFESTHYELQMVMGDLPSFEQRLIIRTLDYTREMFSWRAAGF